MDTLIPFYPALELIVQYCTRHLGKVVDCKDPEGRGRVRVSVPGLRGKGKKNWTDFIEVVGPAVGGTNAEGDEGDWIPLEVGQSVLVEFASGDPEVMVCRPGPPCQKGKGKDKQYTPKEAKIIGKKDPRQRTRLRIRKSTAGHTLLWDDRGKKEKFALMDWTGSGLFMVGPGKEEDEKEKEGEASKPRKGERRGLRMSITNTQAKPSEILKEGHYLLALIDLIRQGIVQYAEDKYGLAALFVRTKDQAIGPSIVLDGKNGRIYLTAGDMQLQILGDKGKIAVTRQIIQEIPEKTKVEPIIEAMLTGMKEAFDEFKE